ncbi:YajD family HNH nuclease [Desulfobulbus alkaliphilus]|uniref:YajD family HNH nuclease n=1 Tax=Desulfobulbus alkaliphilus TaxID=869814 RepID=UPI001966333C|nr:HNH nuclease family protein [Desulfobulbus alkaliphilus]
MKKAEYREKALKLFSWVCASCGRDFTRKNLRELTVHHKDHNYQNNPLDGSNWELLCIYCHDNEHARHLDAQWLPSHNADTDKTPITTHSPFAGLGALVQKSGRSHQGDESDEPDPGTSTPCQEKGR